VQPGNAQGAVASLTSTEVPTATTEPVARVFLPRVLAEPMLPICNHFELSDVPDNQELFQWVNSCCKTLVGRAQDGEDDYYLLHLQQSDTLTVTLSHIPEQADYDLVLYDEALDDYLAYSTRRSNADEEIVYTVTTAGNYYLRVLLHDTIASNRYRFCVEVAAGE
jgi:hypothetical protein